MIPDLRLSEQITLKKGKLKIIIGAAAISTPGWILTEQQELDVVSHANWEALFEPGSLDNLLAEHVWEHIAPRDQETATRNCFKFLKPGGVLRIAVPDGFRTDRIYQEEVLPPRDGHTMMFTYKTLSRLLVTCGFEVRLLEFFDESGAFHHCPWNDDNGPVRRSLHHDTQIKFSRTQEMYQMNYTSLIADGIKSK